MSDDIPLPVFKIDRVPDENSDEEEFITEKSQLTVETVPKKNVAPKKFDVRKAGKASTLNQRIYFLLQ